jgi:hypothetical protein
MAPTGVAGERYQFAMPGGRHRPSSRTLAPRTRCRACPARSERTWRSPGTGACRGTRSGSGSPPLPALGRAHTTMSALSRPRPSKAVLPGTRPSGTARAREPAMIDRDFLPQIRFPLFPRRA